LAPLAAKALFFCLDTKEPKNQASRNASLPHVAFALQIRQNLGCIYFALLSLALPPASAKTCYALQPHRPPLFCLLSPEAVLLADNRKALGVKKNFGKA